MATLEDELKDLKEKNNELVQKVQYWKMTAAQRENEKLNLMKEINELRLKLSRLRSNGNVQASNLDAALQSASEKALAHLVRASSEIARTMDLAKAYMRDRQELDADSPRWSSIGGTPSSVKKDKVHRVPPLMMGGQSIQPVVALTMLNTSNPRANTRSPNPNRNVTERAVPVRMLQDVYIPLTRIDADVQAQDMETEDTNANNSTEDLELDDSEERVIDESQQMTDDGFDSTRRLDAVAEDLEPEHEEVTPPRSRADPLEGPSWMLDATTSDQGSASKSRTNLEPDSTTELEEGSHNLPPDPPMAVNKKNIQLSPLSVRVSCEFSPTVRRRKRTASPPPEATPRLAHFSPRAVSNRRISNSGRVLKVLVAKMRLDGPRVGPEAEAEAEAGVTPPKRAALAVPFDAPSPNGATVAGVIVSDNTDSDSLASGEPARRPGRDRHLAPRDDSRSASDTERGGRTTSRSDSNNRATGRHDSCERDSRATGRRNNRDSDNRATSRRDSRDSHEKDSRATSRHNSCERDSRATGRHDSHDSDSGSNGDATEGRTRRARKVVTYKEKPLNRKLRR